MKMRRIFSAVLAMVMLLSLMPVVALGVTTNDIDTKGTTTGPYNDSELYLGKTATLENDGSYTIRLEAFATGNPVTTQLRSGLPLDIVLVLDQSGSMFTNNYLETLRESVAEFINTIAANGRSVGVTHRVAIVGFASDADDGASSVGSTIAGGSNSVYVNTGAFLEDGSFKNYGGETTSYVELDSEPALDGTYYVYDYDDREYLPLTVTFSYNSVSNPALGRTDLFARVNSQYLPATYVRNAYNPVTDLDTSKTYYVDIDGVKTPITATVTTEEKYTQTNTINNEDGQVYYIDTDTSADGENWITVTCKSSWSLFGGTTYTWTGSDGNTYTRSGTSSNRYFTRGGNTYYAHNRSETTATIWSTADGTVIDPTKTQVYDLYTGWLYQQNGAYYAYSGTLYELGSVTWKNGSTTYDPATVQFYEQGITGGLTDDDYRGAMMPVTDGEAGAGSLTAALGIAVSKIAASGATRTALGLEMAQEVLDNRSSMGDEDVRQTVVVVFTDGTPGYMAFEETEANSALAVAAELKAEDGHNATVYTIGLYPEKSSNNVASVFMHGLSSNYPNADSMGDVAGSSYNSERVYLRELGLTEEYKVVEEYFYNKNGNYYPVQARLNGNTVQARYVNGNSATNISVSNSSSTNSYATLYKRVFDSYDTTGKHYLYASEADALKQIFPEIVTDSTTTTLDQKWLTADTVLRDIMENGFVFTNGTTVTMSTLAGTSDDHMITWADAESVIDSVTVADASAEKTVSKNGYISVHNQGGYHYIEATGFDFNKYFFGTSNPENGGEGVTRKDGAKLIITIEGVEATDLVTWNQTNLTNNPYSGVWSPVLEDGTRSQIGVFPEPKTFFTDTIAVLDYAKTTADLADDLRQEGIKHLDTDGMNRFDPTAPTTELTDGYGRVSYANGELTYTPTTMKWDGYDTFFAFGNTTDAEVIRHSANKVYQNLWSKVTVIPANNVYYEDTFVETNGAEVGIEYTGSWDLGDLGNNIENPEDDVHGWEDSLADDTGHSDGTAAVGGNGATATFTFTGTGVDIYSRTNMQTGLVMASIYDGEKAEGVALRTLLIDNFAHSGDYYMIPTLSIHKKVLRVDGKSQYDENGNVMLEDLPYGTYTVKLTVIATTDDADFDNVETTRSTYYLDGIRVYNPMAPENMDSVAKEAYGDEELNAAFVEVRDILLDANSFSANPEDSKGPVFIDQIINKDEEGNVTGEGAVPGSTTEIGVYETIGPENEVYLSGNQMIAFAPGEGEMYYVGLKSPTGEPVTVYITGADGSMEMFTVEHTTDLFYEIGSGDGIVTIMNMSEELLSITKIKATHPDPEMMTFAMFRSVSREEVLEAADAAYAAVAEPEEPEIEIEIENPETQEPEQKPGAGDLIDLVIRIIDDLWDWFH